MTDYTLNAGMFEGGNICAVSTDSAGFPGRIGREIFDDDVRFVFATNTVGERVKVEPFQMWFSKIVDGVVEIETVDVSYDLAHLKRISQNEKGRNRSSDLSTWIYQDGSEGLLHKANLAVCQTYKTASSCASALAFVARAAMTLSAEGEAAE